MRWIFYTSFAFMYMYVKNISIRNLYICTISYQNKELACEMFDIFLTGFSAFQTVKVYTRNDILHHSLTIFNKICHSSQRPRFQVGKEAIDLSRVQQCSSTCNHTLLRYVNKCSQSFSVIFTVYVRSLYIQALMAIPKLCQIISKVSH